MKKKVLPPLTEEQIEEIGRNIAGLWGGEFIEHEVEGDEHCFFCIEHGEAFYVTHKTEELYQYLPEYAEKGTLFAAE